MKAVRTRRYKHICTLSKIHQGWFGRGERIYVDIVIDTTEKVFNAWLYDSHHGIKESMFGIQVDETIPEKEAVSNYCDLVDYWIDEYADNYLKDRHVEDFGE